MVAKAIVQMPDATPAESGMTCSRRRGPRAWSVDLRPQLEHLAPALVVHEEGEWGGPIIAAMAGVPSVAYGWAKPALDGGRA